jgi:hypothetical protein
MSTTNRTTVKVAGFTSAGETQHDDTKRLMNWEYNEDGTFKPLNRCPLRCTTKADSNIYYPPERGITGDMRKKGDDRYYHPSSYSAMQGFFGKGTQKALETELTNNGISANLGQVRLRSVQLEPDLYSVETGQHCVNMSKFTFEIIPKEEIDQLEFDNTGFLSTIVKKADEMLN